MMHAHRHILWLLFAATVLRADSAHAHGTPIHVEVAAGRLVATTGLTDPNGFAPTLAYENDDDGDPFAITSLPGFGQAAIWQIPGYDIFGLAENSGLSIEPIARPVAGADPAEDRVLWYWNPETELVEPPDSSVRLQIRKTPTALTTISANSQVAPAPLQLAAPVSADMGFHNHLVLYAIDATAPAGAYGFFARLTSNVYGPSEAMLLVFNHGVTEYEQMSAAALAINAAAVDSLLGDFNQDGRVDAADYTVWRDGLGGPYTAADYDVWKSHFGQPSSGGGAAAGIPVPEPAALMLAIGGATLLLGHGLSRSLRIGKRHFVPAFRP